MKKAFTLIELMIVVAILGLLAAIVVGGSGGCSVSDGTRTGTISKFSNKGIFVKSHEGELILGGVIQGKSASANVWEFSCLDKTLVPSLESAVDNGNMVSLKYHQTLLYNPFRRNTSYLITSVTVVTNR